MMLQELADARDPGCLALPEPQRSSRSSCVGIRTRRSGAVSSLLRSWHLREEGEGEGEERAGGQGEGGGGEEAGKGRWGWGGRWGVEAEREKERERGRGRGIMPLDLAAALDPLFPLVWKQGAVQKLDSYFAAAVEWSFATVVIRTVILFHHV
jgi:hypothetical protein